MFGVLYLRDYHFKGDRDAAHGSVLVDADLEDGNCWGSRNTTSSPELLPTAAAPGPLQLPHRVDERSDVCEPPAHGEARSA